jgi:hypothetical protein
MIRVSCSAFTGRSIFYASFVIGGGIVVTSDDTREDLNSLRALKIGDEFRESSASPRYYDEMYV